MKKSKIIVIILVVLALGLIGAFGYIYIDANKKANEFLEQVKVYKKDLTELTTGDYIDFSVDKNPVTKAKISEGVVFVDADRSLKVISNIKINGFYCTMSDGKFDCNLFNKKDDNLTQVEEMKEYSVGEAITLADGSKWHTINSSSKYSKYVTLIMDGRVDINGDNFTMDLGSTSDPDRIPFDKGGQRAYDVTRSGNIGYYLENDYKSTLSKFTDVVEVRLLSADELEKIKEVTGIDVLTDTQKDVMMNTEEEIRNQIGLYYDDRQAYYTPIQLNELQYKNLMPNWLFNSFSGNFWLYTGKKVSTAVWDGNGYTTPKATTGYSLKPVITLSKSNL